MLSFNLDENGKIQKTVDRKKYKRIAIKEQLRKELETEVATLSADQRHAFDAIVNDQGGNIFLTGGAGTGKSYALTLAVRWLREEMGKRVAVTSSTATAARLVNGVTVHSFFRFKPEILVNQNGEPVAHAHRAIVYSDVIVIDEISMIRCDVFSAIAASIERADRKRETLGWPPIRLICVGDFCQLPPVIAEGDRAELERRCGYDVGNGFAFLAPEWNHFHFRNFELKDVLRQDDAEFVDALNKIRTGDRLWADWFNDVCSFDTDSEAMFLYPYNNQVKKKNRECLNALDEIEEIFHAELFGEASEKDVEDAGLDFELHLKEGCMVMIRCNPWDGADWCQMLDIGECKDAFCNGSMAQYRYTVTDGNGRTGLMVTLLESGRNVIIYPERHDIYRYDFIGGKLQKMKTGDYFYAYPVSLGYATSVHRSQGASLPSVNLNPRSFASGMLYVGLSRVKGGAQNIHLDEFVRPWDVMLDPTVKGFYENTHWE